MIYFKLFNGGFKQNKPLKLLQNAKKTFTFFKKNTVLHQKKTSKSAL